jgi:oligosaccharyl transferase (archaeosortase A-associated)
VSKFKISPAFLTAIFVAIIAVAAFLLRVCFSYDLIFSNWIKFASADTYYNMHLVDIAAKNFPNLSTFDPYLLYPGGSAISGGNMFMRVMAAIASLFGIVTPSQHTIDLVGVFTPPVVAALAVIVVFFIGKELFGKWGGILSAVILAILPGEFLSRSKLGFTDYHCFEVLLTSLFILFIILALKAAKNNELKFGDLLKRNWAAIRKPVIYSLVAGLVFITYALTWQGAPLFLFIVFAFLVVQYVIDHIRKQNTDYLTIVSAIMFMFALIWLLLCKFNNIVIASLAVALISCIGMGILSRFMAARKLKPALFPASLLVLAGAGFGIFYLLFNSVAKVMLESFVLFNPSGTQLTTIEMQPLISSTYGNPFTVVWNNYNTTFFLAFAAMAILIYVVIKKGSFDKTLLLVWSVIILIANLAQRRFGYYYGVNVALLTGYIAWLVIDFTRSRVFTEKLKQAIAKTKELKGKRLRRRENPSLTVPYTVMSLVMVIVFFTAYFWSIEPAIDAASRIPYAPSDAWCSTLTWMKDNTPDPFEGSDVYDEIDKSGKYLSYSDILTAYPDTTNNTGYYKSLDVYYPYPDTAYGVLSWWDYGYWITRIAHRIPNANPGQDPRAIKDVAAFFTAQNEETAKAIGDRLDSEYVVIDYETAYIEPGTMGGKFWAVITWAGLNVSDFFELYLMADAEDNTRLIQRPLFYPEYYRSMAVRMYNFDCEAVTPSGIWVIKYDERKDQDENVFKVISDAQQHATYQEAVDFIASQTEGNYRIVSSDPMVPCTPLESLEHYKLEYGSEQTLSLTTSDNTSAVKIFKYIE